MRFIRYRAGVGAGNSNLMNSKVVEMKGIYDKDTGIIRRIHGSVFLGGYSVTEEVYDLKDVTVIAPVTPYTIICVDNSRSYVKSASSLGGSGSHLKVYSGANGVYCTPRLAYIVEPRAKGKLFGCTLMLDFSIEAGAVSHRDSSVNYTVLGSYIYVGNLSRSTDIRLKINNDVVAEGDIEAPKLNDDIFTEVLFLSGDIVATRVLSDDIFCQRGDAVTFTYLGMSVSAIVE